MPPPPLRAVAALALVALGPVAAFWLGRGEPVVGLSAACVVLIAGSLYRLFEPPAPG